MTKVSETSIKERLKNLAKEKGTSVNELLKKLYLERFLARLHFLRLQLPLHPILS
jgi:hypothetical protein